MSYNVAIVGLANVGKTSIFNQLTRASSPTGNWHGVTVGSARRRRGEIDYIDLPGFHDLGFLFYNTGNAEFNAEFNRRDCVSVDQLVTFDYLNDGKFDCIMHVTDVDHLRQGIIITKWLESFAKPVILVINKIDLSERREIAIDVNGLSQQLGCPVVVYSARDRRSSKSAVVEELHQCFVAGAADLGAKKSAGVDNLAAKTVTVTKERAGEVAGRCQPEQLFTWSNLVVRGVVRVKKSPQLRLGDMADHFLLRSFWGVVAFLMMMTTILGAALYIGGLGQDIGQLFIDKLLVNSAVAAALIWWPNPELIGLLQAGIGVGISTVASFICPIFIVYFSISLLEESGYMARASLLANRLMNWLGLPGRALVPLILGLGCNVTAIMGARLVTDRRQRWLLVMMIPFVMCSARLAVMVVFVEAFFTEYTLGVVGALYLLGFVVVILTGLVFGWGIGKQADCALLDELPNYNWPSVATLSRRAAQRTSAFILGAAKMIIPMAVVCHLLLVCFGRELPREVGARSEVAMNRGWRLLNNIGVEPGNWPAVIGLIAGAMAKETVIGALHSVYAGLNGDGGSGAAAAAKLASLVAVGQRESEFKVRFNRAISWWFNELYGGVEEATAPPQPQVANSFLARSLRESFSSPAAALRYMVFVLLYFPCISVFAIVAREMSYKTALLMTAWSTGIAYITATLAGAIWSIIV